MEDQTRQAEGITQLYCQRLRAFSRLSSLLFTSGEDSVLLCLITHEGTLLSGDIMALTGLTSGRVANILRQLEAKKWIQRLQDASDKRKVHVHLTDAGQKQSEKVLLHTRANHQKMVQYLRHDEAQQMLLLLEHLSACLDASASLV
ncbi:MAG: winged helix-turn-helix transcriptional regulator [Clostridia bacterium]|nr:winged helix-turn-helix transcriptional regulator [Clostridia bacterium]